MAMRSFLEAALLTFHLSLEEFSTSIGDLKWKVKKKKHLPCYMLTRLASPEEVFSCQGIIAARNVKKSDHFINHLISRLHSAHKCWYLVVLHFIAGRELTTLQIRDTINPYLQSLLEEHGNFMVDLVKNFPTKPIEEKPTLPVRRFHSNLGSKKPEVVSRVSAPSPTADLCSQLSYLLELGMDLEG
ncbi:hypothetical protein Pint_26842 [Pistacia integerrima]|uniref:Uncharacterized protein n=1 Tax=Pistacia integerrima TaxID=434235 RepID=A0ACC0YM88_9ROSI|nr:hypothetical protein Pint_26842 [Pistacia integerrima]